MNKLIVLLMILFCIPIVIGYSNNTGLISEWTFNGNVNDTYHLNEGENNGVDLVSYGFLNGSGYFNGAAANDYVKVTTPKGLDNIPELTINLWVNGSDRATVNSRLVHMNGVYSVLARSGSDDDIAWRVFNQSGGTVEITGSPAYGYGSWVMITTTFKSGNMSVYYNGSRVDTGILIGTVRDLSVPLYIGIDEDQSTTELEGMLDEVTIWNRSLTSSEITTLYNDYLLGIRPSDVQSNQCVYSGTGNFVQNNTVCNITSSVEIESGYNWIIQNSTVYVNSSVTGGNWKFLSGWLHWTK